ncbi:glycoside hydrolase family 15 protein [Nocardioides agariphilus]|jgi:GH15 family glucan-1,4-alpha-glucosidase|uniref:Glycoside hydrolase family 15 protein n=1 Tax=Nocardioides agariphilus TaxID=433664 RepID=A0A930YFY1_9ACTN|nr:glycoside hydrolase family 15 protein [Nocardioides agariphilus]MBF4767006.1 glycoside hydrolase family 15 protein [Nocardioides agariphilus]
MALPIEDYALIGDRHTAALVAKNGSIDWLCLPRFDSPACFAGLLGDDSHGHWQLCPTADYEVSRRYVDDSVALETTFTTDDGSVTLLDVMPTGDKRSDVVRVVTGIRGKVRLRHEWVVRMDYGRIIPWVRRRDLRGEETITAVAGPDKLILRGSRLPVGDKRRHLDEFDVEAGQTLTFSMTWVPSYERTPAGADPPIMETIADEREWASRCHEDVPHVAAVRRSLLTLRLMTHEQTGGIVASPTTSLPEDFGGERNWDYRYCWLRDAALTIESLIDAGYTDEARFWRLWLLRAVAGDPDDLQIMYAVDGARHLPEHTLDHLPGYAGSRPVRIGNAAVEQKQADVLGEVMIALAAARGAGLEDDPYAWDLQRSLVNRLVDTWEEPDHGIWEIRGPQRRFTHSRVMVWAAFDRAVRAVEEDGLEGPVDRWRAARDRVREEVMTRGFNTERNTFTQHDETDQVDASLLVLPLTGFIAGDDPQMLGTIEAIEQDLMRDGLLMRYRTETDVDGLSGGEHPFLACSFWLVSAYAAAGRLDDAHALFDRLVGLVNDVGLLSEEYDPVNRRMVGNFPQAFSHLTLVQAAFRLRTAARAVR